MQTTSNIMYTFRPYEVQRVDYKSYGSVSKGRGINMYPKPRSGHRIVVNDTDIFCFGGKCVGGRCAIPQCVEHTKRRSAQSFK